MIARNTANVGKVYFSPSTKNALTAIAPSAAKPKTEKTGWAGSLSGSLATASTLSFRRKPRCVIRITIHTKNIPATAVPYNSKKAFLAAKMASRIAAIMPPVEVIRARWGTPLRLRRPSQTGAWRLRDNENSMRVERYKFVFALERAAEITTTFMILEAYGIPTVPKARTNGLPLTAALPDWFQGVNANITVMAQT